LDTGEDNRMEIGGGIKTLQEGGDIGREAV
jgi:hypothetical protein